MPIYLEHKPALLYHFNNINDGIMAGNGYLKTPGRFGQGASSYVAVNEHLIDTTKDWHISFWIKIDQINPQCFFFRLNYAGNRDGLSFGFYYSEQMMYTIATRYCNSYWDLYRGDTRVGHYLSEIKGKWTHYEWNYDAKTHYLYGFQNGILVMQEYMSAPLYQDMDNDFISIGFADPNTADLSISELLVTQHCMHTENFTPPTKRYRWPGRGYIFNDGYGTVDKD